MTKLSQYLQTLQNKNILIQGLGLNGGGVGTALFFLENGVNVTITDLKTESELADSIEQLKPYQSMITYVLGMHRDEDFINADVVVKGPGVNPANRYIQLALEHGAEITSDIEIFYRICPCKVYAVTGSKGKSSTVSLIYEIFKSYSDNVFLGGNITISPLTFYQRLNEQSLVILELSSWQLRDLRGKGVRFAGACITNLMHDHQNYYHNMDDYLADKAVIADNQTQDDFMLLPINDPYLKDFRSSAKTYYFDANCSEKADFYFDGDNAFFRGKMLFRKSALKVPGVHNQLNALIAAGFCSLAGIPTDKIVNGIQNFKGAPFRLQEIAKINGVTFINDTTATIPEAAVSAIKSFENVIWIGGGNDKNLDFSCMHDVADIPKAIYLLPGDGTKKIIKGLGNRSFVLDKSLDKLVTFAYQNASEGDVVLFSPGATSFGLFANEFDRGRKFNKYVSNLAENPPAKEDKTFKAESVLVVCAGDDYDPSKLKEYAQKCDLIIGVDGGAGTLVDCGIVPDIVIGDMDSWMTPDEINSDKCQIIGYNTEKDFTDSELALQKASQYNPQNIYLFGGTGNYVDHSLLNIMQCAKYGEKLHIITMFSDICYKDKSFAVDNILDRRFSFFPLGEIKNLRMSGAKYNFNKNDLTVTDVSVGNVASENRLEVCFDSGSLLFILFDLDAR